jgi:hypothetical protein
MPLSCSPFSLIAYSITGRVGRSGISGGPIVCIGNGYDPRTGLGVDMVRVN